MGFDSFRDSTVSPDWALWPALGLSPLVLAMNLRTALLAGTPAREILQAAAEIGLHPLSIAVARPLDAAVTQRKLRAGKSYLKGENRALAKRLSIDERWLPVIRGNGLCLRDPRIQELPEGLAVPALQLTRLGGLTSLPRRLAATWLNVEQCHGLEKLPSILGLKILEVFDCRNLRALPSNLHLDHLCISACPGLDALPPLQTRVLQLASVPFPALPEGMGLRGFTLRNLAGLEQLPGDLAPMWKPYWSIRNCPRLPAPSRWMPVPLLKPLPKAMQQAFLRAGLAGST